MDSNFQHVLVEGRQILDVILIANKDIDSRLKTIESGVICKLNIKKAYDHSNQGFYSWSWKKRDLILSEQDGSSGASPWLAFLYWLIKSQ